MAMAAPPASSGLEAKHYIMAALAVTLVAAAVVTVVSIVLSPARLSFSVTDARNDVTNDSVRLNLTIAAHNPSRRAAVLYQGFFVDVSNSSGPLWVNWMRADVSAQLPLYQRRCSNTSMSATVSIIVGTDDDDAEPFTGNRTSHNFSVMVTAVARFKVGVARTRLYVIKVYCGNVDFFGNDASRRADCEDAA